MVWQKVAVEIRMIDRKVFYLYLNETMTRIVIVETERMKGLNTFFFFGLESRSFINRLNERNKGGGDVKKD